MHTLDNLWHHPVVRAVSRWALPLAMTLIILLFGPERAIPWLQAHRFVAALLVISAWLWWQERQRPRREDPHRWGL